MILLAAVTAWAGGCSRREARPSLQQAAYDGDEAAVRKLLDAGADVGAPDTMRVTALHCAAMQGHAGVVRLLLSRGAPVDARDFQGATPLYVACAFDQRAGAELLLAAGADVNAATDAQTTNRPLQVAAARGYAGVVELLLSRGASVGAVDGEGFTALHHAAFHGRREAALALLAAGADPAARSSGGATPADEARRGGHEPLAETLAPKAHTNGAASEGPDTAPRTNHTPPATRSR